MTHSLFHARAIVGIALLAGVSSTTTFAQEATPPFITLDQKQDSGLVDNQGARPDVIISFAVHVDGGQWLRLYFDQVVLAGDVWAGDGSILRLTSHKDGDIQEMNANHVDQWQKSSAYFNGDTVQVEVLAHPGTGPNRVVMRAVDAGLPWFPEPSQCGPTDDRVLSSDVREARLLPIGCTGWLIDDCGKCFITAGHCTGSLSVVEFNVPLSNSNGSLNHPPASDQYSVDASSLQTNGGAGPGNDWGYFGCFPNTNTGMTPFATQGAAFSLTFPPPVANNTIRITGYGTDSTPQTHNQVQQTHFGPMVTSSGSLVQYQVDTTGGNSGSPVIWEQTGQAIGVHGHGGCTTANTGANSGTGVNNAAFQNALNNPQGICGNAAGITLPNGVPSVVPPNAPIDLLINVSGTPVPGSVKTHWRYQPGVFAALVMTDQGGGNYTAQLPATSCTDTPEFYFTADDPGCGTIAVPPNAPVDFFDAFVGTVDLRFDDNFETNLNWLAENVNATAGFWQRGVPVNDANWAYDPPADSDGSGSCYVTQNTFGDSDVDNGSVRLTSPLLDLTGGSHLIRYDYYLNLTDQSGADSLTVEVNDMGGVGAWTPVVSHTTSGGTSWRTHDILPSDLTNLGLNLNNTIRVRFIATDADPQSVVEAGVDAFQVVEPFCDVNSVGSNYCGPAVINSSGFSASISGSGSDVAAANNLTLTASNMPANENGYFLASQTQGFVQPPGSSGNLCLGGQIARFNAQVLNTGAAGTFMLAVDLTNIPTSPTSSVMAGETWNFTAWFRDFVLIPTSNFTDGLSILFQ